METELQTQKQAHEQVLASLASSGSQVPALQKQLEDAKEVARRAERKAQDAAAETER